MQILRRRQVFTPIKFIFGVVVIEIAVDCEFVTENPGAPAAKMTCSFTVKASTKQPLETPGLENVFTNIYLVLFIYSAMHFLSDFFEYFWKRCWSFTF